MGASCPSCTCLGRPKPTAVWDHAQLMAFLPNISLHNFTPDEAPALPQGDGVHHQPHNQEEEVEEQFDLHTSRTFVEFRVRPRSSCTRSKSAPARLTSLEPLAADLAAESEAGDQEEEEDQEEVGQCQIVQYPDHSHDSPYEPPPFSFDLVRGMTRARRLRVWRAVPTRPHACGNRCSTCCSLDNTARRLASMQHEPAERLPGRSRTSKTLEVPHKIPERILYLAGVGPEFVQPFPSWP